MLHIKLTLKNKINNRSVEGLRGTKKEFEGQKLIKLFKIEKPKETKNCNILK